MKKLYLVLSAITLLLTSLLAHQAVLAKNTAAFHTADGKTIAKTELQGKWILVNYWASWCGPCAEEVQALNDFADKYRDKVMVIGVNFDQYGTKRLNTAIKKMGITYTVLQEDPGRYFGLNRVDVLPTSFVINPKGEVVNSLVGPQTQHSLEAALGLNSHLAKRTQNKTSG